MSVSRRWLVVLALVLPSVATAVEPRIFIVGVWPDRIRYFDEETESFVGELRVRYGAVWHQDAAILPDYSRLYVISDQLESVEIIDLAKLEVVDAFKLSTPTRKIRLLRIAVSPSGSHAFLSIASVQQETDRIVSERPRIVVYDLRSRQVVETIKPPRGAQRARMKVSPDGRSLFLFGRDIYELSTSSYEVVDTIALSEPRGGGYGAVRLLGLGETEPGIYYGGFRTSDPFHAKNMFGVARLDLTRKELDIFELGPQVRVDLFALSPDGKRGYAGLTDFVIVDMETRQIVRRQDDFERGRANSSLIVSADGTKLYVSGVGDQIEVYSASDLAHLRSIFAGGDVMLPPRVIPRSVVTSPLAR